MIWESKMAIDIKKKRQFKLGGFIKILKLISVGVGVFAIAGIAIYPLISNKPVDKVKEKTEETTNVLPPANYTMIMGKQENEVVIKFHKQASELHLKNISTEESNSCVSWNFFVSCSLQFVVNMSMRSWGFTITSLTIIISPVCLYAKGEPDLI